MSLDSIAVDAPARVGEQTDGFFVYFLARDSSELEAVYRMRYQVYCVERGFVSAAHCPGGVERDEYDDHSIHILATHRSGHPAGTARLVLPSPLGFPLMRYCTFSGEYEFLNDPRHPALAKFAEISRLAVSKTFRQREGDSEYGGPPRRPEDPRHDGRDFSLQPGDGPEILLGASRLIYQETKRRAITHWMVAMERGLHLMLKRIGFRFIPAGPEVDYYGPVRPYVTNTAEFERYLYHRRPNTLRYFVSGLDHGLVPDSFRDLGPG
ncbi:PEP-CTERM/exosortase system-associated acyltransferase [Thioalkalicoccus limnaeus]|uniref:PEP-CTERM/exosortase system-associated acyltransferase n=1 Tax=Thioalkalicoccus limnaeus TaxID=120681 RepID=A0ABV4BEY6_9GAMM